MSCGVLIPVKRRGLGKTRLAPALTPVEREQLVDAMLRHVLDVAASCPEVERIHVLGGEIASDEGKVWRHPDVERGLNAVVRWGTMQAWAQRWSRIVILPADLPGLTAEDMQRLCRLPSDVVGIAPDRHGTGTNALSLPVAAGHSFRFAFGEDSFARHHAAACDGGFVVQAVHSAGLARDIDEPADLADAAMMSGWQSSVAHFAAQVVAAGGRPQLRTSA